MSEATLYLIPVPIAEGALHTLPADIYNITGSINHYIVENVRTARRFLRSLHANLDLNQIQFSEIDKHDGADVGTFKTWIKEGHKIGILSESGCPGIADPGAELAAIAQQMGIKVVPVTGPSSIVLSLMASGLNGQSFCFNGYLPVKEPERSKRIKYLEQLSAKEKQTQIFIETPYRNGNLFADFLKNCMPKTRLCIAQNLTAPEASVKTLTIEEWKKKQITIGKVPVVFLILA